MEGKVIYSTDGEWVPHRNYRGVSVRNLLTHQDDPVMHVAVVHLQPGAQITVHTHEQEAEMFYVISGKGICTMAGQEMPFPAGACGYAPAGIPHGLANTGESPLELLTVFIKPPR